MSTTPPAPPLAGLLLLLSVTTGLVDAVSVLGLDKVFSANMTGNIVFLGFGLVRTPGFSVLPSLTALVTFFLGALVAGRVGQHLGRCPLRQWLTIAAGFETILLWSAAAIALSYDPAAHAPGWGLYAIVGLTAVAMGFRNATIRQLKVPDLTTTVLTLTITGIAADSRLAGGASPNLGRRIAAVFAITLGAAIGAVLVLRFGLALPLLLSGVVVLTGTIACLRHPAAALPRSA